MKFEEELDEKQRKIAQKRDNIQTHIIKGANHFYYGHELDVVNVIDSILINK